MRSGLQIHNVFPQPSLSTVDLEAVLARLNAVKAIQRHLQPEPEPKKRNTVTRLTSPFSKLRGCTDILGYIVRTCLFILNYPLVGLNSLKDVSATGKHLSHQEAYGD